MSSTNALTTTMQSDFFKNFFARPGGVVASLSMIAFYPHCPVCRQVYLLPLPLDRPVFDQLCRPQPLEVFQPACN